MLVNPFLTPPQVEGPRSRSWGRGFAFGFQGPPASVPTPTDVEDEDAFQQGVLAGQEAVSNGLDIVDNPCTDLNKKPPAILEFTPSGFEAITIKREILAAAFASALFSTVLLLADLSMALETHFDDPREAIDFETRALQNLLNDMGITDSMQLFLGGGIDFTVAQCELKLTPVFRSASAAHSAALALGRNSIIVVSWRTDQSGGMTLVEAS